MPPVNNEARTAFLARVKDIHIHHWTGLDQDSDMYEFMCDLVEQLDGGYEFMCDNRGLVGPRYHMRTVRVNGMVEWPQGGPGCMLQFDCDAVDDDDTSTNQENTSRIAFFTAGPNSVHDIVIVRFAKTTLCVQLKIAGNEQGERLFEGLSLAGDDIFSISIESGQPYLCFAFAAQVKTHLLKHTQCISNSTKIVVLPLGEIERPIDHFSDLMRL